MLAGGRFKAKRRRCFSPLCVDNPSSPGHFSLTIFYCTQRDTEAVNETLTSTLQLFNGYCSQQGAKMTIPMPTGVAGECLVQQLDAGKEVSALLCSHLSWSLVQLSSRFFAFSIGLNTDPHQYFSLESLNCFS